MYCGDDDDDDDDYNDYGVYMETIRNIHQVFIRIYCVVKLNKDRKIKMIVLFHPSAPQSSSSWFDSLILNSWILLYFVFVCG